MSSTRSVIEYTPQPLQHTSNIQPHSTMAHVVYFHENMAERTIKHGSRNRCLCKAMVLTVFISACFVCGFMIFVSSIVEKNVVARLSAAGNAGYQNGNNNNMLVDSDWGGHSSANSWMDRGYSSLQRRSVNQQNQKRERRARRRRAGRQCRNHQQKSAIHLTVTPGNIIYFHDATVNRNFFVWERKDNNVSTGFSFKRTPNHLHDRDIMGIKIRRTGLYDVYSQVVVRGQESLRIRYFCAQEILLLRQNRIHTTLLESYITQNNAGRPFGTAGWYPVDSVYQHGVFYLQTNDQLRVSLNNNCNHVMFDNGHPHAFYFGVAQK